MGVITVIFALAGTAPIQAQTGTRCRFDFEVTLSPGFSMSPSSGTHAGTGPITCDGPVNGQRPTGVGTLTDEGRYGTSDGDSCISEGEGDGVDTIEIPVAGGIETVISEFTYTMAAATYRRAAGLAAGEFQGTRFTGTFEFSYRGGLRHWSPHEGEGVRGGRHPWLTTTPPATWPGMQ